MRIVFTGGGTGGHFYPIIAVAERVNQIVDREKIIGAKLFYLSNAAYDKKALFENNVTFIYVSSGKRRLYASVANFFDLFKIFFGTIGALLTLFRIYPDVVFSKGGYASFPVVCAARILRIPVFIHESDSHPGRVNAWSAKFAVRIALSYAEAGAFFPKEKIALTGQPIRMAIRKGIKEGVSEFFQFDASLPVLVVIGGSLGAEIINNVVLDALPELLERYQVIHQVGIKNMKEVSERAGLVLEKSQHTNRYRQYGFLNELELKMAAGAASLVISRAGSTIFEIASWGVPSLIIPITSSNGSHQLKNAFNYARAGACIVIEENNLTAHILSSEIDKIIENPVKHTAMSEAALTFSGGDAAMNIAEELIKIALSHD